MKQNLLFVQDKKIVDKLIHKCTTYHGFKVKQSAKHHDGYYTAKIVDKKGNEFTITTAQPDSVLEGLVIINC